MQLLVSGANGGSKEEDIALEPRGGHSRVLEADAGAAHVGQVQLVVYICVCVCVSVYWLSSCKAMQWQW